MPPALREAEVLDDGVQRPFEGVSLGNHSRDTGVVDRARVVEGLPGGVDAVGRHLQIRRGGQSDEPGGLDGRTEGPEICSVTSRVSRSSRMRPMAIPASAIVRIHSGRIISS